MLWNWAQIVAIGVLIGYVDPSIPAGQWLGYVVTLIVGGLLVIVVLDSYSAR